MSMKEKIEAEMALFKAAEPLWERYNNYVDTEAGQAAKEGLRNAVYALFDAANRIHLFPLAADIQ